MTARDSDMPSAERLDPQVRRFVAAVTAAFARFPGFDLGAPVEARRIAELVRAPWRAGGPAMGSTAEHLVPAGARSVRIRVYDPSPATRVRPALIYLHGGGWTLFSLDTHDRVMREYAARAGVIVVGVDYALSPEARFPVALEQTVSVVRWLATHGHELGIDPERVAIGGDSAGANLSLAAALSLRDSIVGERGALRALLLNYGAFDTYSSPEAIRTLGPRGAMLEYEEMQRFWANYLGSPRDAENPLACPLRANLAGLPPVFLTIPEFDLLTEQSVLLAEKLTAAAVPVRAEIYAGATHSFLEAVSIADVADRALADGARWLSAALTESPRQA